MILVPPGLWGLQGGPEPGMMLGQPETASGGMSSSCCSEGICAVWDTKPAHPQLPGASLQARDCPGDPECWLWVTPGSSVGVVGAAAGSVRAAASPGAAAAPGPARAVVTVTHVASQALCMANR